METDKILTPVDMAGPLDSDDREILAADRDTLAQLVAAILANKRLAALIVHAWVNQHDCLLLLKD